MLLSSRRRKLATANKQTGLILSSPAGAHLPLRLRRQGHIPPPAVFRRVSMRHMSDLSAQSIAPEGNGHKCKARCATPHQWAMDTQCSAAVRLSTLFWFTVIKPSTPDASALHRSSTAGPAAPSKTRLPPVCAQSAWEGAWHVCARARVYVDFGHACCMRAMVR